MVDSMSILPGESICGDSTTLNDGASSISRDDSLRRLVRQRRASSVFTANSASSVRRVCLRLFGAKEVVLGSLMLLPMIPRISSARREFAMVRRGSSPAPLLKQRKVLEDLLKLTRDEMPSHIRKSALKFISYSFEYLVQQMFSASTRKHFISALSELCDEDIPFEIREEGLMAFYYIVGAATSLRRKEIAKDFALEHEDCRVIQIHAQTITQVSLKLCCYIYLSLANANFADHLYQPISEAERKAICTYLSELTQPPLPLLTRRTALELLWRFESSLTCGLSPEERSAVWTSILEISGFTDRNAFFQYHFRQTDYLHQANCELRHWEALEECFVGLRCLWKFNLLPTWAADMQEFHETKKKYIGADLHELATTADATDLRRRAFFMIVLFANLSTWEDMYDMPTWKKVNDQFAVFCLSDSERVDRDNVMQRVQTIFRSMLEPSEDRIATPRRELHISKNVSVVIRHERDQLLALTDTVKKNCGPDLHLALENLFVFTVPGEPLLMHKNQQSVLYERICSYTKYEQTREIAIQAMFALLTIQEWIKAGEAAESGIEE